MDLDALTHTSGEWLRGSGPDSDIVISSRIRLARNLAEFPFPPRTDDAVRAEIETLLRKHVQAIESAGELSYFNVNTLEPLDRQLLVERQLISREHADSEGARSVIVDPAEKFSVMVNEEDHLRIQVMESGLALAEAWDHITRIDDLIEEQVTYAFNDRLGYRPVDARVSYKRKLEA